MIMRFCNRGPNGESRSPATSLNFHRKKVFAEKKMGRSLSAVLIASSADGVAQKNCRDLGIDLIVRNIAWAGAGAYIPSFIRL